eukprot:scaffold145244_cov136-Phaeocystis_antarctica.AAC.1
MRGAPEFRGSVINGTRGSLLAGSSARCYTPVYIVRTGEGRDRPGYIDIRLLSVRLYSVEQALSHRVSQFRDSSHRRGSLLRAVASCVLIGECIV